ncbi:hypothetical protein F4825DRAFT_445711, partial [Nemania diffusa]
MCFKHVYRLTPLLSLPSSMFILLLHVPNVDTLVRRFIVLHMFKIQITRYANSILTTLIWIPLNHVRTIWKNTWL